VAWILCVFGAGACGNTNTATDAGTSPDQGAGADAGSVWSPVTGIAWQWQLSGAVDTSVDVPVYDIDLFDVSASLIDDLHTAGRIVICYFSAGSVEDWRPDAAAFDAADVGNTLDGWPGERWLDVRSAGVRAIMEARLDLAVSKSCDAVEPDNVDGYQNGSGFSLTEADQLDFNRFLADAAHARGLSVGLKNSVGLIVELEPRFDWALNEECLSFNECDSLGPFLAAGKAVFHTEYVNDPADGPALEATVCSDPARAGFSTLIKTWDLDPWLIACP